MGGVAARGDGGAAGGPGAALAGGLVFGLLTAAGGLLWWRYGALIALEGLSAFCP
jgi:hypothetical protein